MEKDMLKNITERTAQQRHQSQKRSDRDNGKRHLAPASREEWAEVLATAERYY